MSPFGTSKLFPREAERWHCFFAVQELGIHYSNSELNFPCGSCLVQGKVSQHNFWTAWLRCRDPLTVSQEFGFKFHPPQTPQLMLPATVSFFLCLTLSGMSFFFLSFSSQWVSKDKALQCSQASVMTHLLLCPGNQRKLDEARMLSFVGGVQFMIWTHSWIIDAKTGNILPSVGAGQLWESRGPFVYACGGGREGVQSVFFSFLSSWPASEGKLVGVLLHVVLCFLGFVHSVMIKVELIMFPSPCSHCLWWAEVERLLP